jgi:hypothetical protein
MSKDYITIKTNLKEGQYAFQVKVEGEGLVLDVFKHIYNDDYEHIITKTAWYEDLNIGVKQ